MSGVHLACWMLSSGKVQRLFAAHADTDHPTDSLSGHVAPASVENPGRRLENGGLRLGGRSLARSDQDVVRS